MITAKIATLENRKSMLKKINIYTDGACSRNPGPGGWGACILYRDKVIRISGYEDHTTNNRMELLAVIRAIERVWEGAEKYNSIFFLEIFSDSAYVVNNATNSLKKWKANGYYTSRKEEVKNVEMWKRLSRLLEIKDLKFLFTKVKGHSGNKWNEECDKMATNEIKINKINL